MEKVDFSKGIFTVSKPIDTPAGYYNDAMNMRVSGSNKRSEEGTKLTNVPEDIVIWGDCSIGDDIVILGQRVNSDISLGSVIGILDKDGNWTAIVDRGLPDTLVIIEPTQIEGRKDWKGDKLIYFTTKAGARKINLDTYVSTWIQEEFDKNTLLFLEYDLPLVKYTGESNNGQLASGVYQVAVRLVTASGAGTVFGIPSNVVPVVSASMASQRADVDGDVPQTITTKAINFMISNIDITFKYVEVAVLTFEGISNTPKVTLLHKFLINNRSSFEISYRGAPDDAEPMILEEFITSGISYETGKYLAQKDGSLLIAGVKETDLPPIDWFRIANNIKSRYIIKKIPYKEDITFEYGDEPDDEDQAIEILAHSTNQMDDSYHNPHTSADLKSYRRDEVYAFTMTPVFTSGVYGSTIHIPADHSADTPAVPDGTGSINLPTTVDVVNLTSGALLYVSVQAVDIHNNISSGGVSIYVQLLNNIITKPENLTVDNWTSYSVELSFDPPTYSQGFYPVEYKAYTTKWVYGSSTTIEVGNSVGNPPNPMIVMYDDFPLSQYVYVVAIDNTGVASPPSDSILIQNPGSTSVPPPTSGVAPQQQGTLLPPTNLVASDIGTTRFTLTWDASPSPDIKKYNVFIDGFVHTVVVGPDVDLEGSGTLGTFLSEHTYDDDRYIDIPVGSKLRLHKFPSLKQEPIIGGDISANTQYIRAMGVEFSNIMLNSEEQQYSDLIAGIIIGRVSRVGQETQLAQGIIRPIVPIQFNDDLEFTHGPLLFDGTGAFTTNYDYDSSAHRCLSGNVQGSELTSVQFIAPDIIHRLHTAEQGSYIKQCGVYETDPLKMSGALRNYSSTGSRTGWSKPMCLFKNITKLSSEHSSMDDSEVELDGTKITVGPFGVPLASGTKGGKINTTIIHGSDSIKMASSDGFTWLKTSNNNPIKSNSLSNGWCPIDYRYRAYRNDGTNDMNFISQPRINTNNSIYTLTRRNPKQYGPLDQMVGISTIYEPWGNTPMTIRAFNGDTFINRYALTLNDEAFFPYTTADDADNPQYVGFAKPANMSGIFNFWLESSNNYAYRHYVAPKTYTETAIESTFGSTPYFPAYKHLSTNKPPLGILSMREDNWVRPGYASQYNNQYSYQGGVKPYPVIPKEDLEEEAALGNRVIYSTQVVQGEKADSYQIFLPNDYYDVPQEFGELTDLYVNRELFASTSQVQWKLFFNTLATQITSAGEVVLGTGGAFNRPAIPMQTVDGGYGGTAHWVHAENTIFGRVFVDKLQGRIFILTDQLKAISSPLDEKYKTSIPLLQDLSILVGSEPLHERVFIRLGQEMYSYHVPSQAFISRHGYLPRWMFSHSQTMYSDFKRRGKCENQKYCETSGIYKHSAGESGRFYGIIHKSYITVVMNSGGDVSKLFQNINVVTLMETEAGLNRPFDTFEMVQAWNDERNTGEVKLAMKDNAFQMPGIMEELVSKVKDGFRFVMPRDLVIDPNIDIFNTSNLSQHYADPTRALWLAKMRGNFVVIKLIADVSEGPIYVLKIQVGLSQNIR